MVQILVQIMSMVQMLIQQNNLICYRLTGVPGASTLDVDFVGDAGVAKILQVFC